MGRYSRNGEIKSLSKKHHQPPRNLLGMNFLTILAIDPSTPPRVGPRR